jgi:hypothetical protein
MKIDMGNPRTRIVYNLILKDFVKTGSTVAEKKHKIAEFIVSADISQLVDEYPEAEMIKKAAEEYLSIDE